MKMINRQSVHCNILPSWRGLIDALSSFPCQHRLLLAEYWYQNEALSRYGSRPEWDDLLHSLSRPEPVLQEESLKFMPSLCLLDTDLQNNLLLFLIKHQDFIPTSLLSAFIAQVESYTDPDSWSETYLRILRSHCRLHILNQQEESTDKENNVAQRSRLYQFTARTRSLYAKVREDLLEGQIVSTPWCIEKISDAILDSVVNDSNKQCEESISQKFTSQSEEEKEIEDSEVIMIDDYEEEDYCKENTSEEPPAKRQRIEKEARQEERIPLDPCLKAKIDRLLDQWKSGNTTEVPSEMEIFSTCSDEQITDICKSISSTSLSDVTIATACHHLATIDDVIVHSSCVTFLSYLVLPQFCCLTQTASRVVTAMMSNVADKFSRPLIDGVLIPCIQQKKFGAAQVDVMVKVVRDHLQESHKLYLLRCLVVLEADLDEFIVTLYQTTLDSKTHLSVDDQLLMDILRTFHKNSQKLQKSLKFGKLILALLSKYGHQMKADHLELFTQTVQLHNTFLKKTLESNLKKLKT